MVCPICETKIADPKCKQCPQCNSDLEVFAMIASQENSVPTPKVESSAKSDRNQFHQSLVLWFLSLGFVGVAFYFGFQIQRSILEELKQERLNRISFEERQAKITEKLIDKTTESYSSVAQSFTQTTREHRESIQLLNEKISNLEQQVLLEKMKAKVNRAAR